MSRQFSQELDRILSHTKRTQTPNHREENAAESSIERDIERDIECGLEYGKDARAYAFSLACSYTRAAVVSIFTCIWRLMKTKNKT